MPALSAFKRILEARLCMSSVEIVTMYGVLAIISRSLGWLIIKTRILRNATNRRLSHFSSCNKSLTLPDGIQIVTLVFLHPINRWIRLQRPVHTQDRTIKEMLLMLVVIQAAMTAKRILVL